LLCLLEQTLAFQGANSFGELLIIIIIIIAILPHSLYCTKRHVYNLAGSVEPHPLQPLLETLLYEFHAMAYADPIKMTIFILFFFVRIFYQSIKIHVSFEKRDHKSFEKSFVSFLDFLSQP